MYQAIVFLPLLGALIAGLAGTKMFRNMGSDAQVYGEPAGHGEAHAGGPHDDHHGHYDGPPWPMYLTTALLFISCVLSWIVFLGFLKEPQLVKIEVLRWVNSGDLHANWALRIDTMTAVMLVVVTTISSLVHLYSIGYMGHDEHQPRFFAFLSLFTFAMLMLVTSDNLLQLFFGWEGVGLMSYLLIGFWYTRDSANAAAIKAFVVNRVGDFGFALGIFGTFYVFNSIDFDTIFGAAAGQTGKTIHFLSWNFDTLTTLGLLLFMGAMGKSAQFLLHTWLPDAMEGPTPVSALIHAATMVTAGVFMVARLSPLYELAPYAKEVIVIIGAVTAFFAATVALVQNDIKRVIAYSTCSQLGYMFVALGVGAYGAGIFHLFTHAFFKALMFLGSGSVIHAMSGEQDMRKMGGLAPMIRVTWVLMMVVNLALTGFPFTAGYYSKDAIIEASFVSSSYFAFTLLVAAAFCTSFYSWRLAFMTFHGESRSDHHTLEHVHESPRVMLIPLFVLAAGALLAGYIFKDYFIGRRFAEFWNGAVANGPVMAAMEKDSAIPAWAGWSPVVAMVAGFALAFLFYIRDTSLPVKLAARHEPLYKFLLNKWYFDELYWNFLTRPAMWLGRFLWQKGDGRVIDGFGPDGVSARVIDVTRGAVRLQTGYVYHYAFAMMIGVAALISWFMFGGAR
ncbi:MAG: NADH-quinone oxidoreductase subunit L [Rhizobiales bacterium]|nr:NADH-quinone oxidoreductase subunit L [Hyphomicrobiales bacterium]